MLPVCGWISELLPVCGGEVTCCLCVGGSVTCCLCVGVKCQWGVIMKQEEAVNIPSVVIFIFC